MANPATLTTRFGPVEYCASDVVHFMEGLIGFPGCREFVLLHHRDDSPFRWMQSLDEPAIAFLVVDPAKFFPNYAPEMDEASRVALDLEEHTPRLVYTIVTIPNGKPELMTLNLAGPIVINAATQSARQLVLSDESLSTKQPVFAACEPIGEPAAA